MVFRLETEISELGLNIGRPTPRLAFIPFEARPGDECVVVGAHFLSLTRCSARTNLPAARHSARIQRARRAFFPSL